MKAWLLDSWQSAGAPAFTLAVDMPLSAIAAELRRLRQAEWRQGR
jgi:hypothetical protein